MSRKWTSEQRRKYKATVQSRQAGQSNTNVRDALVFLNRAEAELARTRKSRLSKADLYVQLAIAALEGR